MLPTPVAVVSAEKDYCSEDENLARTRRLEALLASSGYPYWPVIGRYGGRPERSFMIACPLGYARHLGRIFAQDSVLWIDGPDTGLYFEDYFNPGDAGAISYNGDETDYYSVVQIGPELIKFAVPIDFSVELSPTASRR